MEGGELTDGYGEIQDNRWGFRLIPGRSYNPNSKYYQPYRLSGAIYQVPGRQSESGATSQPGVKHQTPASHVGARQAGGQQVIIC